MPTYHFDHIHLNSPDAVKTAEQEQKKAEQEALTVAEAAKKLADVEARWMKMQEEYETALAD